MELRKLVRLFELPQMIAQTWIHDRFVAWEFTIHVFENSIGGKILEDWEIDHWAAFPLLHDDLVHDIDGQ